MKLKSKEKTITQRVSEWFLNGLIVLVPPAITIFVVMWILNLTEGQLGRIINEHLQTNIPGIGIISIALTILLVGLVTGNMFAKTTIELLEMLLDKIPVVKFIYSSVKQFSTAIFASNSAFKHVVLVPYQKSYVLGFLLTNVPSAVRERIGVDYVCVYVPWSLNMTAGMNLFVRRQDLVFVNMPAEDALQFILTAGTNASHKKNQ